jgi:AraC family transcriptional regulator, positive regulator of tynA and feaB
LIKIIEQSTAGLRSKDTFDFWWQSAMPFVDAHHPASAVPFSASRVLAMATLGTFMDTRSEPVGIERMADRVRQHQYDQIGVSLFLSGDGYQRQGERSERIRPGDIAIVDMGRPFASGGSSAYRELRLHLPRKIFAAQIGRTEMLAGRCFPAGGALQALFAAYYQGFADALPAVSAAEADRGFEAVLHLLQSALGGHASVSHAEVGPQALRGLAEVYMRRHLHDPDLDPMRIAAALNVSRTRLYEAFSESEGIAATLLDARLDAARRQIVLPGGGAIGVVLLDCGFRDSTSFNRAFRRRFGMTPTELRAMSESR